MDVSVDNNNVIINAKPDRDCGLYSMDLVMKNPSFYAQKFSEGDRKLEEFLILCYKHGIYTRSCCNGGHHNSLISKYSQIVFDEIKKDSRYIKAMMNSFYPRNNISITFSSVSDIINKKQINKEAISFGYSLDIAPDIYKMMSEAINSGGSFEIDALELRMLYQICIDNNLPFIPRVNIAISNNGDFSITFYETLSCLSKNSDRKYLEKNRFGIEERLEFNNILADAGMIKNNTIMTYKTSNYIEMMSIINYIWGRLNNISYINKDDNKEFQKVLG